MDEEGRPTAYDELEPDVRALVDRWVAELQSEPTEVVEVFCFLTAMAAVQLGVLREVERRERNGKPVVVLVNERLEEFYEVKDPQLGDAEAALTAEMKRVLGGAPS